MHFLWVLLAISAVLVAVQGQPQPACDSVGDASPVCRCTSTRVNCKNAGLTDVPTGIPSGTRKLDLSGNRITSLPKMVFDGLSRLDTLDLSDNKISSIDAGAFGGLGYSVDTLDLSNNELVTLEKGVFRGLRGLLKIYLSDNNLIELKNNSFGTHRSLSIFNCNNNKLTTIDAGFFSRYPKLAYLYLSRNNLASLPPGVFDNLSKLWSLDLSNNELESLDDAAIFKDLSGAGFIDLRLNKLKRLASGIFSKSNLIKLKFLALQNNSLSVIENGAFDNLPSLQSLDLQYNPLENVDCGIVPTQDMSPSLERFSVSCTCEIKPLYSCPNFAWVGVKTRCEDMWTTIIRISLDCSTAAPMARSAAHASGTTSTNWITLAAQWLFSNLFIRD
ncbi:chondroadherin-like protein [Branchiostoma lanceolatum]|uniref:chondroadherin-like protein n=1 Tax=Branchiostoma lanceolatum TaxID=7740 RepID=UPI003455F245